MLHSTLSHIMFHSKARKDLLYGTTKYISLSLAANTHFLKKLGLILYRINATEHKFLSFFLFCQLLITQSLASVRHSIPAVAELQDPLFIVVGILVFPSRMWGNRQNCLKNISDIMFCHIPIAFMKYSGLFLWPVANTCRATSSNTTGRASRFINSIDLSCLLARCKVKQDRQCTYNITLRHIRANVAAVEKE